MCVWCVCVMYVCSVCVRDEHDVTFLYVLRDVLMLDMTHTRVRARAYAHAYTRSYMHVRARA